MMWKRKPVAEPDTGFLFTPCIFPYQVANLLCNEFITSKTFLLDFVNNKMFENHLYVAWHVWRENVMLWRVPYSSVTSQHRLCMTIHAAGYMYMWNRNRKINLNTNIYIPYVVFLLYATKKRHCCYNIITTISHVISSEGIHGTEKYVWSGLLLLLNIPWNPSR